MAKSRQERVVKTMTKKNTPSGTIILAALWIIIMAAAMIYLRPSSETVPPELQGVLRPGPKQLQPFNLTDQNKAPFTQESLKGKWTFMFFGYTFCPDICPTALSMLTATMSELDNYPDEASDVQVIFVSVDPQRDPPERLAKYMTYFNKDFLGVTGEKQELDALAGQIGAGYLVEPESAPGEYLISHTSTVFLTNPKGELMASFSQPHYPKTIVEQFRQIRALF